MRAESAAKLFAAAGAVFLGGTLVWAGTRGQEGYERTAEVSPSVIVLPVSSRPPAVRDLVRKPGPVKTRRAGTVLADPVTRKPAPTISVERYRNCTELRKVHPDGVPYGHPAYEVRHDRDRDLWACENFGAPISPSPSTSPGPPASPTPRPSVSPSPATSPSLPKPADPPIGEGS